MTMTPARPAAVAATLSNAGGTVFAVLVCLSVCHMLNDTVQSLLPAIYPVLERNYGLSYTQIGLLHFAFQGTASLLQPLVGHVTDKRPVFRLASIGMGASLLGLLILAGAHAYWVLVVAAMTIGIGSSIFHPESSRMARAASGGRHGLAQSLFQVGGNTGTAFGPLLAAYVVVPFGQGSLAWFSVLTLAAMALLWFAGGWAKGHHLRTATVRRAAAAVTSPLPHRVVVRTLVILMILTFSKHAYIVSLSSYYTFYLIDTFHVSVRDSQLLLFVFLFAGAAGTFAGGPIGDRIGRKAVIWVSIVGALPFALILPHVGLVATAVLSAIVGFVISSAFSAIVVYAMALVPGRVGTIAGMFFGLAFGIAGVSAALLGVLADATSIRFVFLVSSFLPVLGLLTAFIPSDRKLVAAAA